MKALYLLHHTGHYGHALFGFPDDLEEALRKFDELIKEEERMTIAYIQLTAENSKPCFVLHCHYQLTEKNPVDKNVEHVKKDLQEVRLVQGTSLFSVPNHDRQNDALQLTTIKMLSTSRMICKSFGMFRVCHYSRCQIMTGKVTLFS